MLHRRIKTGKDEIICTKRLSLIPVFEKTFTKNSFFPEKNSCFLKKHSQRFEIKKLLHPSEISVKC